MESLVYRAIKKFPDLNARTDFPFFRTLHSLAFYCLSMKTEQIMQAEHYKEFAAQAGIELSVVNEEEMVRADHPVLNEVNLARIRGVDGAACHGVVHPESRLCID